MAVKFFGRWLIERGCVTAEQLLTALDVQQKTNNSLGAFAVEARILTQQQADEIIREQRRSHLPFGGIAESMGLLTTEQVERLLERQRGARRYLGEILVEEGILSHQEVTEQLEAFHVSDGSVGELPQEEETQASPFAALQKSVDDSASQAYVEACLTIFHKVVQRTLTVSRMEPGVSLRQDHTVMQVIDSNTDSFLALSLPASEMLLIAERMLRQPFASVNQMVLDAGKELLNLIMGNVAGWLSGEDESYTPQPPQMVLDDTSLPSPSRTVTYFLATIDTEIELVVGWDDGS